MTTAPAVVGVATKGSTPKVRTEGTDIVVSHEELFAIVEGHTLSFAGGLTTNSSNVHNYLINPTESSVFPWLSPIADRYEKYRVEALEFSYVPMVGTSTRGQVVLSLDYDPADEMSTEATMDTRMMLTSKPDSIALPAWQTGELRCAPQRLNRVGERFVRNWAGEQEVSGPVSRTSDLGVLSVGLFNVDESLEHVVYGDLRVRYRIRLMTPQLQKAEAEQPCEAIYDLAGTGSAAVFDLKTGELTPINLASAVLSRAGPELLEPIMATQVITEAVGLAPHAYVRIKEDCAGRLALKGTLAVNSTYSAGQTAVLPTWGAFFGFNEQGSAIEGVTTPLVRAAISDNGTQYDREYYAGERFLGAIARSAMSDTFKMKHRYDVRARFGTTTTWDLVVELVGRFTKGMVLTFLCNPSLWAGSAWASSSLSLQGLRWEMMPRASFSATTQGLVAALEFRADPVSGVKKPIPSKDGCFPSGLVRIVDRE